MLALEDVRDIRNRLLQSTNLRSIDNLEMQLQQQGNLTQDVSRSLVMLLQVAAAPHAWHTGGCDALGAMHRQHVLLTNTSKSGACICRLLGCQQRAWAGVHMLFTTGVMEVICQLAGASAWQMFMLIVPTVWLSANA